MLRIAFQSWEFSHVSVFEVVLPHPAHAYLKGPSDAEFQEYSDVAVGPFNSQPSTTWLLMFITLSIALSAHLPTSQAWLRRAAPTLINVDSCRAMGLSTGAVVLLIFVLSLSSCSYPLLCFHD